jgi:hypothetical protein
MSSKFTEKTPFAIHFIISKKENDLGAQIVKIIKKKFRLFRVDLKKFYNLWKVVSKYESS